MLLHGLAPYPVDEVKSSTSESHAPMVDGLDMITEGICGLVGGWIATDAVGAKGRAEQLQALGELPVAVHSPLMVLAISVKVYPTSNGIDGLKCTNICSAFDDHWHELKAVL